MDMKGEAVEKERSKKITFGIRDATRWSTAIKAGIGAPIWASASLGYLRGETRKADKSCATG